MQKMKLDPILHYSQKLTQNSIILRPEIIKLQSKLGKKLFDIGFGNDFLYTTPKTLEQKQK